ncbi:MAG: hypothetical protein ACK47F_00550 [Flavobacteriales bacterium]
MLRLVIYISFPLMTFSCGGSTEKKTEWDPASTEKSEQPEKADLYNPVLIMGTDIGTLFKTYYKIGDFKSMVRYTDKATVDRYGNDSLMKIYRKLNLGYDIRLKNMTTEGNEKILHYESSTFATRGVRRLHVVVENDTARVVPQDLDSGDIFE